MHDSKHENNREKLMKINDETDVPSDARKPIAKICRRVFNRTIVKSVKSLKRRHRRVRFFKLSCLQF